ncbi:hypothetical protein MMPV_005505 [Pyropia vietnamensis]
MGESIPNNRLTTVDVRYGRQVLVHRVQFGKVHKVLGLASRESSGPIPSSTLSAPGATPSAPALPVVMNSVAGGRLMWAGILASGVAAHAIGTAAAKEAALNDAARTIFPNGVPPAVASSRTPPSPAIAAPAATRRSVHTRSTPAPSSSPSHPLITAAGVAATGTAVALAASAVGVRPPTAILTATGRRALVTGLAAAPVGAVVAKETLL